jgi:NAD(P)H dehydrogenase (quinone)
LDAAVNVLVIYAENSWVQLPQLAAAVVNGARSVGATARCVTVEEANYKRDVYEWADAIVLGSGVYNGNPAPAILEFINSFDISDTFSSKVGGSFATAGSPAAGLQPVLEQLNRALRTFGCVVVGGSSWKNSEGTGAVVQDNKVRLPEDGEELRLAQDEGARVATIAGLLKGGGPTPTPAPVLGSPPSWGENWTASVSANLTQVGYDAGLVIVNFTGQCGREPSRQKMKTVYGDFYTVLTRCDLGREFTISPQSRGGECTSRLIGRDIDSRICSACGCPFCVRDTNGSFTHGEGYPSMTTWTSKERTQIAGREVMLWQGTAMNAGSVSRGHFSIKTSIAYSANEESIPVFVNVSHPLWMQTSASIEDFRRDIDPQVFDIPSKCYRIDARMARIVV